jgi:uncharacterized membrane protein YraQ (UPF0718 family)
MENTASCCNHEKKPWYKEPLFLVLTVIAGLVGFHFVLLYFGIGILTPVFARFLGYLSLTWWAILLGLLIGGLVDILIPEQLMVNLLSRGKKSIFIAVLLGFLASACSHGILAIAVSLYKKGASSAATLAFLLAAPWANFALTVLLFSLFGLNALFIIFGAIIIATISGLIFQVLEQKGIIEGRKNNTVSEKQKVHFVWPGWKNTVKGVVLESWMLSKMVVWWILIGFLVASFLGTYVPEDIFHQFFGPSILGLLATLIVASIIEVCSEGSAPMAFELFQRTGAFGNAFVFLQAGVVTDFTEIGIIASNIGKKAAVALILVGTPQILLLGYLLNRLVI